MFGILALSTVIVAVGLFLFAFRKLKNKKWKIIFCNIAVSLLLPASLFLGVYANEKQEEVDNQVRKDIGLFLKTEKIADGESLVNWEYDKKGHLVLFRIVNTYKVIFVVKNKETGKEREEIIQVNGDEMDEVISEVRENNALRERLNEQRK
ncbi:hypothetical protein HCA69_15630 [Listeria grandensis]|uniref:Uncharacterized protein n=1 Tax=Listeria grandensis TaxID=1494963 RepID=A0A7X0Y6C8_9LIST|nr:hypothetical protein [Listeria grandensis]MBC1937800.1 hypothetical protein [Listeria grandensis]